MYDKYGWDQARLRIKPVNVVFDEPGDGQEKQIAVVEHLRNARAGHVTQTYIALAGKHAVATSFQIEAVYDGDGNEFSAELVPDKAA
jgi:hypothetical protein